MEVKMMIQRKQKDSFDAIKYIENLVTGTKEYSPEICGELCDIVHNSIEEIISTSLYHRRSKDDLDINFDNKNNLIID